MWSGSFPCSPFSPNLLHVLPSGMTGLHNLRRPGHSTICHFVCYDLPSIKMWTSRDDMESLTSWIFNSWRDRNRSKLTNFSMSRPVVFVLLFEFQNSKLFPSLPEISKQLWIYITKKFGPEPDHWLARPLIFAEIWESNQLNIPSRQRSDMTRSQML